MAASCCSSDIGAFLPAPVSHTQPPECRGNAAAREPGLPLFWVPAVGHTFVTRRWDRLVSAATILTLPFVASGQGQDRWRDSTATTHVEQTGQFVFTRIRYGGYRSTWNHDYPRADLHLPQILDDITMIDVHLGESNVFRLDDPELFTHPIAYIGDVPAAVEIRRRLG